MNPILLFLLMLAMGCASSEFVEAQPDIRIESTTLDFGTVLVGGEASLNLEVRNFGRGPATIRLQVAPPFTSSKVETRVEGGARLAIPLMFRPEEIGSFEGTAFVRWLEEEAEVELLGAGTTSGTCDPSDDCKTIRFEPGRGCVEEWEPEGTACEGMCLEGASCTRGRCEGSARNCDDDNPCTFDTCDRSSGCQNIADPDLACGSSGDDPCVAFSCDPEGGCLEERLVDGTSCGDTPATCEVALVCIGGKCLERPAQENGACGEATPCLEEGRCRNGVCVQPAKELRASWFTEPSNGVELHFDGVTDPTGRLFWVECAEDSCLLAFADVLGRASDGTNLERRPMFQRSPVSPHGRLMLTNDLLVSSFRQGWIEVFGRGDGARGMAVELGKVLKADADRWEAVEMAATSNLVFALVEARKAGRLVQGWAVAFSLPEGELQWAEAQEGTFEGLLVDELGRLFFHVSPLNTGASSGVLVSLGPSGEERWRMPAEAHSPLAVAFGRILDGSGNLRKVENGTFETSLPLKVPLFSTSALLGPEEGYVFGYPMKPCDGKVSSGLCPVWSPHYFRFDPWDGSIAWLSPVGSAEGWDRTEPILTDEGATLFAQAGDQVSNPCQRIFWLAEIAHDQTENFVCPLPPGGFSGPTSLQEGKWAVADRCNNRLQIFDLGEGRNTMGYGWATSRGNPGRSGMPR